MYVLVKLEGGSFYMYLTIYQPKIILHILRKAQLSIDHIIFMVHPRWTTSPTTARSNYFDENEAGDEVDTSSDFSGILFA